MSQVIATVAGVRVAFARVGADQRETSRRLLAAALPDGCALIQVCPACGGAHGPVRVRLASGAPGPLVSVSYAGGFAAAAVAPDGTAAFGIDVECDDAPTLARVREALAPSGTAETAAPVRAGSHPGRARHDDETPEAAPTTIADWTEFEAVAKARGIGLRGLVPAPDAADRADAHGFAVASARVVLAQGTRAVLSIALG